MDSPRLNFIACANLPTLTLSPIVLDQDEINRSTANVFCKQAFKLSTREIQNSIKAIILDGKEKSSRINSPVRQDQSYFGLEEEFVVKNMKNNLPQFFCHTSSEESRSYCESLCIFSRLIAREIVSKINNRVGMMLSDTSEGSCDGPETLNAVIALIGNITNCLRTSSTTHSPEEDQDLHEDRGDKVRPISHLRKTEERGKSDDGVSGDECSDDGNGSDDENENSGNESSEDTNSGDESSEYENSGDESSENENSGKESSEDKNSGDESSEYENSGDESSDDEESGDESSEDGSGTEDSEQSLCTTSVKPRQASGVRHPREPRRMPSPNLAHIEMALVITGLVTYTIKKAKVPPRVKDARSLIQNLLEKAKQQIKSDKVIVTTFKNRERIHKAAYKELLKKIGTAEEVLQLMEQQRCDSIYIDQLRIQLMSPPTKKKGFFGRLFHSMGKFVWERCTTVYSGPY